MAAEGIKFNSEQIALSGTREIFVRSRMLETAQASAAQAVAQAAMLRVRVCCGGRAASRLVSVHGPRLEAPDSQI